MLSGHVIFDYDTSRELAGALRIGLKDSADGHDLMSAPRLSVDDWITAGYALLGDEGLGALKIDRLCTASASQSGSFTGTSPISRHTAPR